MIGYGLSLWTFPQDYVEPSVEEVPEESEVGGAEDVTPPERKVNHRKIVVTEVVSPNNFWAQLVDQGV